MNSHVEQKYAMFAEAVRLWRAGLEAGGCPERMPSESAPIGEAVGRVPAQVARTKYPSPMYRAAAMDGYAVRSADAANASDDAPVRLRIGDGAVAIDTGGPVPAQFDAVVAIERVKAVGNRDIEIVDAVAAGKNVRLPGDDVPPGVAVGWPTTALRPLDCAALLASGVTSVDVVKRARLAVIPSGDEVVTADRKPAAGTVIESNSLMIAAEARALGADVMVWPAAKDDDAALESALREAIASADVVVLIAGSAAGRRDRGAAALSRIGTIDVRGVATRPARPVILGHAGAVALINLPGYPVSCHFAFEAYVAPLLRRLGGFADPAPRRARLAESIDVDGSFDEWRVATLLTAPGSPRAIVVPFNDIGGGFLQLAQADARFALPRGTPRFGRHASVGWTPLRGADDSSRPLFVGPYDPLIEELAALGAFRCRWTDDETGEALDDGTADAVGLIIRDGDLASLRKRSAQGRRLLPIGVRSEGICSVRGSAPGRVRTQPGTKYQMGDPWEGAAAVLVGVRPEADCTRYVAERFDLQFEEDAGVPYAIVWEDRPGHRFPWGIVLHAGLSALTDAAPALGWKSIGSSAEVLGW